MIALLLAAAAMASEPPPVPSLAEPVPGQCAAAHPMSEGDPLPPGILDGTITACSGVVVPTSQLADLLALKSHGELVRNLYTMDTANLEDRLAIANARIFDLEQPVPWIQRPHTQRWLGGAVGVILGSAITVVVWQKPGE